VLPAHLKVNFDQLGALIPAATLRLASEPELANLWPDCELGATLPFATRSPVRVFVDRSLVGDPEMVFSAGTHTEAIRIHYWDFHELTQPVVGHFAERTVSGGCRMPVE
jgi:Ala-tRNA(Pro) deacylase